MKPHLKRYINIKQNYKFFFQSFDEDFGLVKEEITNDNNILPKTQEGKIVCFLTPGEEPKVIYSGTWIPDRGLFVIVHVRLHGFIILNKTYHPDIFSARLQNDQTFPV